MQSSQDILWWNAEKPEGNLFKLGPYLKKLPIVFKLSLFTTSDGKDTLLGTSTLISDPLVNPSDSVKSHILYLTQPACLDSYITLRTVFTPYDSITQK